MSGTDRARRITRDLVTARLIVRLAHDRRGGAWGAHPLSGEPERVIVSSRDATPTFLYAHPLRAFSVRRGECVAETRVGGSVVQHVLYDRSGRVVNRATELVGDPRMN